MPLSSAEPKNFKLQLGNTEKSTVMTDTFAEAKWIEEGNPNAVTQTERASHLGFVHVGVSRDSIA